MLHSIGSTTDKKHIGNKAASLNFMLQHGLNVPAGVIIDSSSIQSILSPTKHAAIEKLLQRISIDTIDGISSQIQNIILGSTIPKPLANELRANISDHTSYAIRSSGIKEDLANFSFAGQYESFLNVKGTDQLHKKIIACYASMYSPTVLSYFEQNGLSTKQLRIAVIIQEMVDATFAGVAFSINPITGNDKEIVIEATRGLADGLVSGKITPTRYQYNWYTETYTHTPHKQLLPQKILDNLTMQTLHIQTLYGYPVDIEFAIHKNTIYFIQARAITSISYSAIPDQWTMADFKDGVSATVCTPFMWSLYEYIWERKLAEFLLQSHMLHQSDLRKLGDMFFGRPYWNVSVVKQAMTKVPGYVERDFDNEIGVRDLDTEGVVTKLTAASLWNVAKMVLPLKRIYKNQDTLLPQHALATEHLYQAYRNSYNNIVNTKTLEQTWQQLIFDDYLTVEGTYFWQIFINTVRQTLLKDKLLKHVRYDQYLTLLGGLENISHIKPAEDMRVIAQHIRSNTSWLKYWQSTKPQNIAEALHADSYNFSEVRSYIEKYGFHSDKELDVTYPCYYEDPMRIVELIQQSLRYSDEHTARSAHIQKKDYRKQLRQLQSQLSAKKYKSILNDIETMRTLLRWREELKNISTQFYYLIRIFTLKLADQYVNEAVIESRDDIFFLKIEDIQAYNNTQLSAAELREKIHKNKLYYKSFAHYDNPDEVGARFKHTSTKQKPPIKGATQIQGIGCNNGIVTGPACVVESLHDTYKIKPGDILVTKYTDTGWTPKFAIVAGVITERGGVLCHASIVSREYGIPCIVSAVDATTSIKNGSIITMDGAKGTISINEK